VLRSPSAHRSDSKVTRADALIVGVLAVASAAASGFVVGRKTAVPDPVHLTTRKELHDSLAAEVGLDAEQRRLLDEITDRNHERKLKIEQSVQPQLDAIRAEVRSQLKAMLRDDQKPRFDAWCARRDAERAKSKE
jgi:hypothetical protein